MTAHNCLESTGSSARTTCLICGADVTSIDSDERAARYHGELPPSPGMVLDDGIWVDSEDGPWTEADESTWVAITALRSRAVNTTTRAIARDGIELTHAQADELGEETLDWMRSRLDMRITTTDRGVSCTSGVLTTETAGDRQDE